jgi:hypothetical protein
MEIDREVIEKLGRKRKKKEKGSREQGYNIEVVICAG